MKKIYVLDRIEDGVATIVCDDGDTVNINPDAILNMSVGDVFLARYEGGALYDIDAMPDETQRRKEKARSILNKFKNKKHN